MEFKDALKNSLPNTSTWPKVAQIWQLGMENPRPEWDMPLLSAEALGIEVTEKMVPAVASIACMQLSILLIDDMIDDDPRGLYHEIGAGLASNLASVFQSLAVQVLSGLPEQNRWQAAKCVSKIGQMTAMGQYLDATLTTATEDPEDSYWALARAKSSPFFAGGLQMGAILAGANAKTRKALYDLGALMGEAIQVADDLLDVMGDSPTPDWRTPYKNLLLLYAQLADDPRTAKLAQLDVYNGDLEEAQTILVDIEAVAYAIAMLQNYQTAAEEMLARLNLPNPQRLFTFVQQYNRLIKSFSSRSEIT